jgi:hypothetical protein
VLHAPAQVEHVVIHGLTLWTMDEFYNVLVRMLNHAASATYRSQRSNSSVIQHRIAFVVVLFLNCNQTGRP